MALFSRNKEEKAEEGAPKSAEKKDAVATASKAVNAAQPTDRNIHGVLLKPRITEKAVRMGEKNVYTFIVHKDATKFDVRDAVKELFNVTPVKVNIVNKTPRQYMSRAKGRAVTEKGQKKAYVYLQAGDSIELA